MAIFGRKQLTYSERQALFRSTPKNVRQYRGGTILEYEDLIHSFSKEDYQLYEKLLHAYKRVNHMLRYCSNRNVSGPVLELAKLREADLRTHQKIVQVLRHRWTDIWEEKQKALNEDSDRFWLQMSGKIQRRCKEENLELYPDWEGPEGRQRMIKFLKETYESQNGLCAVSKEPITLTIGIGSKNSNKCSPDRKDSNKGYTPSNLWFVAWWVNSMKMDTPLDVFWKRISVLSEVNPLLNK